MNWYDAYSVLISFRFAWLYYWHNTVTQHLYMYRTHLPYSNMSLRAVNIEASTDVRHPKNNVHGNIRLFNYNHISEWHLPVITTVSFPWNRRPDNTCLGNSYFVLIVVTTGRSEQPTMTLERGVHATDTYLTTASLQNQTLLRRLYDLWNSLLLELENSIICPMNLIGYRTWTRCKFNFTL